MRGRTGIWISRGLKGMGLLLLSCGVLHTPLSAQWTTQVLNLRAGWNAVYLEVDPSPRDSDSVFRNLSIESAWMWNGRFKTVQYIDDPETLVPRDPEWLVYVPPESPEAPATNLFAAQGGRPYLLKLKSTETWTVVGRPVVRSLEWVGNSFNLVGLPADDPSPPAFGQFFAGSAEHNPLEVHQLAADGKWLRIASPASLPIRRGEAYWIYSKAPSKYSGPISVKFEQAGGVHFGRVLVEQALRFKNDSTQPVTLSLAPLGSAPPPSAGEPALAGDVPLSYWKFDPVANDAGWKPLPASLAVVVPAREEILMRLEVRRKDMASFMAPPGSTRLYQGLLVASGAGTKLLLPVTSKGLMPDPVPMGNGNGAGDPVPLAGLWVGTAAVNKVTQPATNLSTPVKAASEFQLRVILHVDDQGKVRLLQHVIQMWKEGTVKPDPADPTKEIVHEPGRFVLLTQDDLVSRFSGAALRDGKPVGRRISSAFFSFKDPIDMNPGGEFGTRAGFDFMLGHDDPLNPFKHKYHPDHDNKDPRFEQNLPEGKESFTVARSLTFEFTATDPDNLALAGWGDNQVGGIYSETLKGLHKNEIKVEGTFRLQRVTRVGRLNDGL